LIITQKDYYSPGTVIENSVMFPQYRRVNWVSNSGEFNLGKDKVKCFTLEFPEEVIVDVFYKTKKTNFKKVYVKEIDEYINVESPESIIEAKKMYLKNNVWDKRCIKHVFDLCELGVTYEDFKIFMDITDERNDLPF